MSVRQMIIRRTSQVEYALSSLLRIQLTTWEENSSLQFELILLLMNLHGQT